MKTGRISIGTHFCQGRRGERGSWTPRASRAHFSEQNTRASRAHFSEQNTPSEVRTFDPGLPLLAAKAHPQHPCILIHQGGESGRMSSSTQFCKGIRGARGPWTQQEETAQVEDELLRSDTRGNAVVGGATGEGDYNKPFHMEPSKRNRTAHLQPRSRFARPLGYTSCYRERL